MYVIKQKERVNMRELAVQRCKKFQEHTYVHWGNVGLGVRLGIPGCGLCVPCPKLQNHCDWLCDLEVYNGKLSKPQVFCIFSPQEGGVGINQKEIAASHESFHSYCKALLCLRALSASVPCILNQWWEIGIQGAATTQTSYLDSLGAK